MNGGREVAIQFSSVTKELGKEFIESIEFMKELIGWSIKDRVHWSQRVHISRVAVLCGWVRLNN